MKCLNSRTHEYVEVVLIELLIHHVCHGDHGLGNFLEHLILEVKDLCLIFIVYFLLFLFFFLLEMHSLVRSLLNFEILADQFLDALQFDLKCKCMLLGNINYLADNQLSIRDQFWGIQGLADDLEHVDVGQRLQRLCALDLENPGQEALKVGLS